MQSTLGGVTSTNLLSQVSEPRTNRRLHQQGEHGGLLIFSEVLDSYQGSRVVLRAVSGAKGRNRAECSTIFPDEMDQYWPREDQESGQQKMPFVLGQHLAVLLCLCPLPPQYQLAWISGVIEWEGTPHSTVEYFSWLTSLKRTGSNFFLFLKNNLFFKKMYLFILCL